MNDSMMGIETRVGSMHSTPARSVIVSVGKDIISVGSYRYCRSISMGPMASTQHYMDIFNKLHSRNSMVIGMDRRAPR